MRWLVLAMLVAGIARGAPALVNDDFDRPNGPLGEAWQSGEGEATIAAGQLHLRSDRSNPWARWGTPVGGDIVVTMRLLDAPGCHWSGLFAKDVYRLTVNRQFSALILTRTAPQGGTVELAKVAWEDTAWDPYDFELRLDCFGPTLRGWVDGQLLLEATDPEPVEAGHVGVCGGWGTDVRIDDFTVRRFEPTDAPPPPFVAAEPTLPELKAVLDRQNALYDETERPHLTVTWRDATPAELRFAVLDINGRTVTETSLRPLASRCEVEFAPPGRGVFKVALTAVDDHGQETPQGDLTSFAVVPAALAERPASDSSAFGAHPHWEVPEFHYELARRLGIRWARNHDAIQYTWWTHVEAQPGQWRWYDDQLEILLGNRLALLGEFLGVPPWASRDGAGAGSGYGSHQPPRDLAEFGRYVYETVRHYKGRIHAWEIWNEPHYRGFWDGTPEEYAALAAVAWREAKRADPECLVVGGGGIALDSGSLAWAEQAIAAGVLDHCDRFSFHYGYAGVPLPAARRRFEAALARLRSIMAQHGDEKPLWNTETAVVSTSFLDTYRAPRADPAARYHYREAAQAVVRMAVVNLACGVERMFYYDLVWPRRGAWIERLRTAPVQTAMLEGHGGPKPFAVAYATAADLLDGARFVERWELRPDLPVFLFQRGRDAVIVTWLECGARREQRRVQVARTGDWEQVDVMNVRRPLPAGPVTVTRDVLFLVVPGADLPSLRAAWASANVLE